MEKGTKVKYKASGSKTYSEQEMELAKDYDGGDYYWVRPIGSSVDGNMVRKEYIEKVSN